MMQTRSERSPKINGDILFAIGMCLLQEWYAFTQGVAISAVGAVALLVLLIVRRKMEGKPAIKITGKVVGTTAIGIVGALVPGVGLLING